MKYRNIKKLNYMKERHSHYYSKILTFETQSENQNIPPTILGQINKQDRKYPERKHFWCVHISTATNERCYPLLQWQQG